MQMVAASKMRKSQERAIAGKPYAEKIASLVHELAGRTDVTAHPLLSAGNPKGKTLVLLISTNKGLVGGLNANLFRAVIKWFPKDAAVDLVTIGKKGQQFVAYSKRSLVADFSQLVPFTNHVGSVIKFAVDGFLAGTYSTVYVVFSTFESVLKQSPTKHVLLPVATTDLPQAAANRDSRQFLIEPDANDLLSYLLPHYLENQLRSALHEAQASEHSAQMIAMKNATDAALDLVDGLTLIYNKARQEKITNEIADIVTARLAVE